MDEAHCRCTGCGECAAHANAPKLKAEIKRLKAQRQWVGLSDFNIDELENEYMKSAQTAHQFLRAIEAKLKEKNT